MDPHEVSRKTPAAPLMTRVSISLLQIIYIKDSKCLLNMYNMHRFK